MHLFVTGGTGFFGKALLRYWASTTPGLAVTVLSRHPGAFRSAHGELLAGLDVRFVEGDVTDAASLPSGGDFTHVIHAATESTAGLSLTPMQRFDHSVQGTRNVLDLAVRWGVRRFLYTSSGGVYGAQPADLERIPEDYPGMPDPLDPQSAYSVAKRVGEHLCALYAGEHGLEPVVARCFAFAGMDLPLDAHFAIGNFVRDVREGRPIVVNGDGTPLRSYLDQRDLAEWLMVLLERGVSGRAYNVGSDQAISIADLARLVTRVAGSSQEPQILGRAPVGDAQGRNRYVPAIDRVRTELGLDVRVELERAISDMMEFHG